MREASSLLVAPDRERDRDRESSEQRKEVVSLRAVVREQEKVIMSGPAQAPPRK